MSVLHRKGVGDGAATWRDSAGANGGTERFLEFIGRSAPEHAAGLSRFGFLQETSRGAQGAPRESRYFGVMTSSTEESAAEARRALHSEAKEAWFSAIEGYAGAARTETVSARFLAPARTSVGERRGLIERARQALTEAAGLKRETATGEPLRPFLHVLADLLRGTASSEGRYTYNGCVYRMRVEKSRDAKAARQFSDAGLIAPGAAVEQVAGKLWREGGGKASEFRLWVPVGEAHPLPLRIEYQPKGYLRLTFEAEA
jgi:hypothetical protein